MTDPTYVTVSKCLAHFDFERIHTMMVAVDWKWSLGSRPEDFKVPTVADLRDCAERLLYAAVRDKGTVGTGGFEASYTVTHERGKLRLMFIAFQNWEYYSW